MKVLAVITDPQGTRACLDAAVMAARVDRDASVEALHIDVDPKHLTSSTEEVQIQRLREGSEGTAEQRAQAAHTAFVAWNAGVDLCTPRVDWCSIVGPEEAVLKEQAATADLIVLAAGTDLDSGDARHAALTATGKPVLLVPQAWRPRRRGFDHIVVAVSTSVVTEQALREAMPWLRAAKRVTALRIGREEDTALSLASQFPTWGIAGDIHVAAPAGDNLGEQIVAEAEALGADMLVAGAYRHNALVEWLLGGTTRHMLAASTLPLLLAH